MRALDIIEYIARRQEASFTEIYTELGLPKSSTYQILGTLAERGYVRHSGDSTKYSLGLKLFEMGSQAVTRLDIRTEGAPVLQELVDQINQTAHLGILDGIEGVYLVKVEGTSPVRLYSWEGKRLSLHCTAMGKVLMAFQEPGAQADLLDRITLTQSTEHTITDRARLVEHLKMVRQRGWALDDQENEPTSDASALRCAASAGNWPRPSAYPDWPASLTENTYWSWPKKFKRPARNFPPNWADEPSGGNKAQTWENTLKSG